MGVCSYFKDSFICCGTLADELKHLEKGELSNKLVNICSSFFAFGKPKKDATKISKNCYMQDFCNLEFSEVSTGTKIFSTAKCFSQKKLRQKFASQTNFYKT